VSPDERLRSFVVGYGAFDMAAWPTGRHRGLPDGTLELVVSVGAPLTLRHGDRIVTAGATLAGLRSGPVDVLPGGSERGVQIGLTPRGSRALLGVPAAEIAERVVPLDDVIGCRAQELADRIAACSGTEAWPKVLDAVLTGWFVDDRYPEAVDAAWRSFASSDGCASVTAVASDVGIGRRHLGHVIRSELGLTPKTLARLMRFSRTRLRLRSGTFGTLADTAAACGYVDQSHLTNEWKGFAGCTPGAWLAEELPLLQDDASTAGAGWRDEHHEPA
jgi:AraC-like DNA-binding protein